MAGEPITVRSAISSVRPSARPTSREAKQTIRSSDGQRPQIAQPISGHLVSSILHTPAAPRSSPSSHASTAMIEPITTVRPCQQIHGRQICPFRPRSPHTAGVSSLQPSRPRLFRARPAADPDGLKPISPSDGQQCPNPTRCPSICLHPVHCQSIQPPSSIFPQIPAAPICIYGQPPPACITPSSPPSASSSPKIHLPHHPFAHASVILPQAITPITWATFPATIAHEQHNIIPRSITPSNPRAQLADSYNPSSQYSAESMNIK